MTFFSVLLCTVRLVNWRLDLWVEFDSGSLPPSLCLSLSFSFVINRALFFLLLLHRNQRHITHPSSSSVSGVKKSDLWVPLFPSRLPPMLSIVLCPSVPTLWLRGPPIGIAPCRTRHDRMLAIFFLSSLLRFLAGIFLFKKTDKQKNAFRHPPLGDLEVACSMRGTVHVSFFISAFSKPWSGAKFSDLE